MIAEQPAPAPHLAHAEGCTTLRIVLGTVPCVSRSCDNFPDGFDVHLLLWCQNGADPAGVSGRTASVVGRHRYDRLSSLVHGRQAASTPNPKP